MANRIRIARRAAGLTLEKLAEHHLPNTQGDIYRVAKAVERDLLLLDEMQRFPATLELRVSEKISSLQLKWQQAKASL